MIYIASKTVHAEKWRALRASGVPILSTWIDEAGKGESPDLSDLWVRCINEAMRASALIAYRQPDEILKGTFIEIGAALAANRKVYLVGFNDGTLSFVKHPRCYLVKDISEALRMIGV